MNDYELQEENRDFIDGTESVTIERFGSSHKTTVENALRRRTRIQDQTQGIKIIPTTWATWHIPFCDDNRVLHIGDEIVDLKQTHWIISKIEESKSNRVSKCVTYSYAVSFGADEYVDLFRRICTPTVTGTECLSWDLIRSGIPAKFAGAVFTEYDTSLGITAVHHEYSERCHVVVRGPCDIEISDRLRMVSGNYYKITNMKFPTQPNGWIEMDVSRVQ